MKQEKIKVSVISPIYNVAKYLPKFFESLRSQTLDDVEFILVDDGSTDNSLKLCQTFAKESNNVKIIHQKNQGAGMARNMGLTYAQGKYIYFCDPDDYFNKNLLADNYNLAEEKQAELVIFGFFGEKDNKITYTTIPPENGILSEKDFRKNFCDLYDRSLMYFVWNKLYLRSSLNNLIFENIRSGQDTRFNLQYYRNVKKVYLNAKPYYHYRVGRPKSTQTNKTIKQIVLRLDEVTELKKLLLNYWDQKDNQKAYRLIEKQYIMTGIQALDIVKKEPNGDVRAGILNPVLEDNRLKEYLNYRNKSFKDKVKIFILKHQKYNLVIKGYNLLKFKG